MFNAMMKLHFFGLCLGLLLLATLRSPCADPSDTTFVRFNTNLGYIDVQLFSAEAPLTVANFLNNYVDIGAYSNSIIHRIATMSGDGVSVIQGGGFYNTAFPPPAIPTPHGNVVNEFGISNTLGTIAMAKLGNDPNSANSQWYFNVTDNTALDSVDGGFTVFGVITNSSGLAVMNLIAAVQTFTDGGANDGGALTEIPLLNYTSGNNVLPQNYVTVYSITPLVTQDFPTWQSTNFVGQPPGSSDPTAIPRKDGVPNLLKYFCGINPSAPMSATDRAKLPTVGTITNSGTTYVTLTYHQSASMLGVTPTVQTSTDLQTWTPVSQSSVFEIGSDSSTGDAIMQAQVPVSGTKQFVRLNLTQ